jgi:hypothetical protein
MTASAWAQAIDADLDEAGVPTLATIVGHIRSAASTESYLLRSRITRALKESYAPFHCDEAQLRTAIHQACEVLVRIGDLTAFQSDGGPGYVATPERLVAIDETEAAILGTAAGSDASTAGLVRRLPMEAARATVTAPLISLTEEIGPPDWRLHILNLGGQDDRVGGPGALFTRLGGLAAGGERLDRVEPDALRVLSKRGPYFGRVQAGGSDGRWTAMAGEGVFCAQRRRLYGWQTCVVSISQRGATAVDVTDQDRWRWAVAGQTLLAGDPIFTWGEGQLQCLTPPPFQLQRLFDVAGDNIGPWKWTVGKAAVDVAVQMLGARPSGF